MLVSFSLLAWEKTGHFIAKPSRGCNDLEMDKKSCQVIEENKCLFICCKQAIVMQMWPDFM